MRQSYQGLMGTARPCWQQQHCTTTCCRWGLFAGQQGSRGVEMMCGAAGVEGSYAAVSMEGWNAGITQ